MTHQTLLLYYFQDLVSASDDLTEPQFPDPYNENKGSPRGLVRKPTLRQHLVCKISFGLQCLWKEGSRSQVVILAPKAS